MVIKNTHKITVLIDLLNCGGEHIVFSCRFRGLKAALHQNLLLVVQALDSLLHVHLTTFVKLIELNNHLVHVLVKRFVIRFLNVLRVEIVFKLDQTVW